MHLAAPLGSRRRRITIGILSLLLATTASVAPGAGASAVTPSRTITGKITDALTGAAVKGAYVTLLHGPTEAPFVDVPVSASGAYSITLPKVAGSDFSLVVQSYDATHASRVQTATFPLTTTTASFTRNVKIPRGATLTGHVDPAASDSWRYAEAYDENGVFSGTDGSVESDGNFSIKGLSAGSYRVLIGGGDMASVYVGGTTSFADASQFTVEAGQTLDTGSSLVPAGATISGTVTTSPGGAAEDATVTLTAVGSPESTDPPQYATYAPFGDSDYTDRDGVYTFDNVAPGTYTLRFRASVSGDNHASEYYPGTINPSEAEKIVVSGTGTITRDFAMPLAGSITGTVKGDGSRATFTSIAYAQDPGTGKWVAQSSGKAYEDDPSYVIPGLTAGTYKVGFTSFSTSAIFAGEYYDDSRTIDDSQTVTVTGTAATKGINAVLTEGGPLAKFATHPLPVITGTTAVRSKLTAVPGTWSPTATTYTYQWKRNGTAISGATKSTYTLLGADAGKAITVTVKGVRSGYTSISQTSAATDAVTPGTITISSVTTSGTHAVGATQKAVTVVSPSSATLTYQWLRDGATISGATKATHKLVAADGGKAVSVRVTAKITGYTTTSQSSASFTPPRALTATPVPKISGTAAVGKKLTAKAGTWSPAPVTLTYQWKRGSTAIAKATKSTYTPTAADRGKKLTVVITGTKDGYSKVAKSSASVTVK